jgi:hypothetical protein
LGDKLPRGRQQIGQFGIGKLATYVLSERLTHISKHGGKYYSTSMDFSAIDHRLEKEVEPKVPITIALRELTEAQAKKAVSSWTNTAAFKASGMVLFGKGASPTWTLSIMSNLKKKVHEIRPGVLEWVLRTALPLRTFSIWYNGRSSSQAGKGPNRSDSVRTSRNCRDQFHRKPLPEDGDVPLSDYRRFGLEMLNWSSPVTRIRILAGKSDEIGRSYGFVHILGRLINVDDGHLESTRTNFDMELSEGSDWSSTSTVWTRSSAPTARPSAKERRTKSRRTF